jgi:thermitase
LPAGRSAEGLIKMYEKNPNVVFAEPDYLATALFEPNDPLYWRQWGHEYVKSTPAWDVTTGSSSVTIAVLDTGLDLSHPELSGRLVAGYDFVNVDSDPSDDHGHGTRVTGIAAATGNNGIGVAGMDWRAGVMPVKVLNASGVGSWSAISRGIIYAADNGAQVINMSLGGPKADTLHSAIKYAYDKGLYARCRLRQRRN